MKRIAVITMARNDDFFLTKWISYYGEQFGYENLFVFLDGEDQKVPINGRKVNITIRPHTTLSRAKGDKTRILFLSNFAKKLFSEQQYDLVIGTDCDEFLVIDPRCDISLKEYLSKLKISTSLSALGLDVGQHLELEQSLDTQRPILSQRNFALLSPRYTKSIIISRPVEWGSGFHRVKGCNFHIDRNLYLFHFGYCDLKILQDKSNDDRLKQGWNKHLQRRAKTIQLVSTKPAKDGDKYLPIARKRQTYLRPIFAWNKPSMGLANWIIKIPERFKSINI